MSTLKRTIRTTRTTVTDDDIRAIVGPLDNAIIAAIRHTDATPDEVLLALEWLEEDYRTKAIFARPMTERIRLVYDILDYAHDGHGGIERRH